MAAGTLYVTGFPLGPEDVTWRALRSLRQAVLVVAADVPHARQVLDRLEVGVPLVELAGVDAPLAALHGGDVVCLTPSASVDSPRAIQSLIRSALAHGFAVVPLPGPCLPITTLAVSGLPADSFVYLGRLPDGPELDELLSCLAHERRTLVAQELPDRLPGALAGLHRVLGDRPLALASVSEHGAESIWRGRLADATAAVPDPSSTHPCTLVVGGAHEQAARWDEDRLRSEVRARLGQGLGAGEVSRQLAPQSGWHRRDVYRLTVDESCADADATAGL